MSQISRSDQLKAGNKDCRDNTGLTSEPQVIKAYLVLVVVL